MVYQWRFINYPVKAQIAGEELERIERSHGEITTQIIVNESREEKAVLHKIFEWNNDVAAEKYRNVQAGELVRNIVVIRHEKTEPKVIRAFVHIVEDKKPVYKSIVAVMKNEDYKDQLLNQAYRDMVAFKNKYQVLIEFAELFETMDKMLQVDVVVRSGVNG